MPLTPRAKSRRLPPKPFGAAPLRGRDEPCRSRCISVCTCATSPRRPSLVRIRVANRSRATVRLRSKRRAAAGARLCHEPAGADSRTGTRHEPCASRVIPACCYGAAIVQQEDTCVCGVVGCAERFSPRIETIAAPREETCGATLVLDISGWSVCLGVRGRSPPSLRQSVRAIGYEASVAASGNAYAAMLAARGMPGNVTIAPGREAETLAPLPLSVLGLGRCRGADLRRVGHTDPGAIGGVARQVTGGASWARAVYVCSRRRAGSTIICLCSTEEPADAALCESMELEHPVELLEPLLFLLSRMLEQVTQRASRRALAIASVETCLALDGAECGALRTSPHGAARAARARPSYAAQAHTA